MQARTTASKKSNSLHTYVLQELRDYDIMDIKYCDKSHPLLMT